MKLEDLKKYTKKIVIFGAVDNERLSLILEYGIHIYKIIDNDKNKAGSYIKGIPVKAVETLNNDDKKEIVVLIITTRCTQEMEEQIAVMGIQECYVAIRDFDEFKNPEILAHQMGVNINDVSPSILNVELSGICNLKCIYCPFHGAINLKKDKGIMNWDVLKLVTAQMERVPTIKTLSLVGGGEIFLNLEWYEMTDYLLKHLNINKLLIYTNGMLLNSENIKKISYLQRNYNLDIFLEISIDGNNPTECNSYRIGASYEKIKNNTNSALEFFKNEKKVCISIFNLNLADEKSVKENNFIIDQNNEPPEYLKKDFPNVHIISRKPNLDYAINDEVPGFKKIEIKKKYPFPICWNTFNRIAINFRGGLLRCSCGKSGIEEIANVKSDDIFAYWKNDQEMNTARHNILTSSYEEDFCTGCELKSKDPYYVLVKESL